MRVLLHTDNQVFSGSEITLAALARCWAEDPSVEVIVSYRSSDGYDPTPFSHAGTAVAVQALSLPDPDELKARWTQRTGRFGPSLRVLLGRLPLRLMCLLIDLVRLGRWLDSVHPDIVQVNNGGYPGAISCRAMTLAAARRGIPVVHVVNNLAVAYRARSRWWDWPVDRLVRRATTAFVTGSTYAGEALDKVLKLPPGRRQVIPNTVLGDPRAGDPLVRASLGIGTADVLVLHLARLEERKGHRYLLEAVADLPSNVVIAVVGDGPERSSVRRGIERLDLGDRVLMLGHRSDVYDLLAAADILVLPSIAFEDFPVVILEAMASGTPVVASRVAGTPEQVDDGITGKLVPSRDAKALADALTMLVADPGMRDKMGQAGRARFEQSFAPPVVAARYRSLHRRILASG